MDARAPDRWRPGRDPFAWTGPDGEACPDWDAIAGARALRAGRRPRRRWRLLRHAWTLMASAAVVGLLVDFAEERRADAPGAGPSDEILAMTFVPAIAPGPAARADPPATVGRFAALDAPFALVVPDPPSGSLFLEAVRLAGLADGLAVVRTAPRPSLDAPHAAVAFPAVTLAVTLEDRSGGRRDCTVFRLADAAAGIHCPGPDATRCGPALPLEGPVRAVLAALAPTCAAPVAGMAPDEAELDGNNGRARASSPQPRRDRATKAPRSRERG
jgi:hypothetical protein